MLTRPIIACQSFLPTDAKQVPSRVSTQLPQLIHSVSTWDDLICVSLLFYSAIKYSVVSRMILVTHLIDQSAEAGKIKMSQERCGVMYVV